MKNQKGMRPISRMVGLMIVALLASAVVTYAARPDEFGITSFSPGTTISSSDVNNNFQILVNAMPRIGGTFNDSTITLSYTPQNIASMTVTPPMDGVLLFIATAHIRVDSGANTGPAGSATAKLCLTQTSGSCGSGSDSDIVVSFSAPTNPLTTSLYVPVTMIEAVPCQATTPVTYYLTAKQELPSAGLCVINGINFRRIFLPGGYLE